MRITLVVPGLLSLPSAALASVPALARFAAAAAPVAESDLESAVLADIGLDPAPAPLAALGAGVDVGTRWTTRADPVSIIVGRDDARLEAAVHDLSEVERETLLALMNAHFATVGVALVAPRADAWFALVDTPQSVRTIAVERAVGVPLRSLLPTGPDAGVWRRWLTETQMLLHDHPLGDRARPVTSLWFSGGGLLPAPATLPSLRVQAPPGREGDLVRGLARLRGVEVDSPARLQQTIACAACDVALVAYAKVERAEAVGALARDVLEPALHALDRSSASSVKLIADGGRGAASWTAHAASWFKRWTRRRAVFVAPP